MQKIGISVVNLHLPWRKLLEKELDFHLIGIYDDRWVIGKEKQYWPFLQWFRKINLNTETGSLLIILSDKCVC